MVAGYRMVVVVCQGVGEADSLGFASAVGCHVSCPPASRPQPAAAARVQLLLADAAWIPCWLFPRGPGSADFQ
jgi:hypothetical protein